MDLSDSMKAVSSRIQEIEPELASKIVGYLLLQERSDRDLIRLAFSPDSIINFMVNQVKAFLGLQSSPSHQLGYPYYNPYGASPFHSRTSSWNAYGIEENLYNQYYLSLDDRLDSDSVVGSSEYYFERGRVSRRPHSFSESPPKVCHYYNRGFCKHGDNCRFIHEDPITAESFSQFLGGLGLDETDDFNGFQPRSLENLEIELVDLLRSRKGNPVSIASLPMLYYERYGRILRAEGPHGQHSVILIEDAPKYFKGQTEQSGIVPGSRQIYLTFPAESTFSEKDVSDYFNTFGPVQDVRIPCQQKRMFGFVTFVHNETVHKVFSKTNPHFVCGSRVLVKPYREKSKLMDRKHADKPHNLMNYQSQLFDGELDYQLFPHTFDSTVLMRKRFMEEHKEALELEKRRHSESQLLPKPSIRLQYISNSINQLKLLEELPTSDFVNFGRDVWSNGSSSDPESDEAFHLPDNLF